MEADKQASHLEPGYLKLSRRGELSERVEVLNAKLESCDICPHRCRVNRLKGETGICRTGKKAMVSSFGPHFGEESPLVGGGGSGTIFFTNCNLGCVFCQNYDISHGGEGHPIEEEKIAEMMMELQNRGCHNINFVTPTHVVPQIVKALTFAIDMPDLKYSDDNIAQRYCNAKNYVQTARNAIREMHRQVDDLVMDQRGIAQRGLLIRHLILPEDLAGTYEAMKFIAEEISTNTYVNLMDQYHPCFRADDYPPLDRRITHGEYAKAVKIARDLGIKRLD